MPANYQSTMQWLHGGTPLTGAQTEKLSAVPLKIGRHSHALAPRRGSRLQVGDSSRVAEFSLTIGQIFWIVGTRVFYNERSSGEVLCEMLKKKQL